MCMRHVSEPIRAVLDVIETGESVAALDRQPEFEARKEAETEAPASFKGGVRMRIIKEPHNADAPDTVLRRTAPERKTAK